MARKLPVYILVDSSGSMSGEPITAVNTGLKLLLSELRKNPYALETVHLAIIEFNNGADYLLPFTDLPSVQNPRELQASGCTAMGEALQLLASAIDKDVSKGSSTQRSDWKPIIFLFTDGEPTDNLQRGIDAIKARKYGVFVACAAGADANTDELRRITETIVSIEELNQKSITAFFKWISDSIKVSSQKVNLGKETTTIDTLPPPPSEIEIRP